MGGAGESAPQGNAEPDPGCVAGQGVTGGSPYRNATVFRIGSPSRRSSKDC